MATRIARARSNWFRVEDEQRCSELLGMLAAEDGSRVSVCEKQKNDGLWHMFFAESPVKTRDAEDPEELDELDWLLYEMGKVLDPRDPLAYVETEAENLAWVDGVAYLVTRGSQVEAMCLQGWLTQQVEKRLGRGATTRIMC